MCRCDVWMQLAFHRTERGGMSDISSQQIWLAMSKHPKEQEDLEQNAARPIGGAAVRGREALLPRLGTAHTKHSAIDSVLGFVLGFRSV